jgi:hypothetical protein
MKTICPVWLSRRVGAIFPGWFLRARNARFAVIVIAIVLGWPSARGFTLSGIADQWGVSVLTISRACARFREMAGLNSAGELRPGAGSLGDKSAVIAR